ncbi:MFS transporter [Streptomyces sp. NBC_00461]|uniref:MFS transporter n=1 Tax=Streptomyces sp. NBC_00461 TaxID=2975750 RepID=UPI002E17C46F
MPTHAVQRAHTTQRPGKPALTMVAALLGLFIALLDVTVVTVALPTMGTDLDASFSDLEWVANAYMLALAVFIVTAGRLGDLYGQRRIYTIGVTVFLAGSLICGGAGKYAFFGLSHITTLHAGRVVQGIGGAVIMPLTLAIIYSSFEGRQRKLGIMLWGAVGGLATALGPLIGGVLVDHAGWEWIFLVNLPIGAVVIAAATGIREPGRTPAAGRASLDVAGLLTVSGALFCLNLALINGHSWGWTSGREAALFTGAVALLLLFVAVEARSSAPIMNLSWFRRPSFGGSVCAGFLLGAGMFSVMFYLSIYLQNGLGMSALETGVRLLPLTLMLILGAPLGGRLAAKLGVRAAMAVAFGLMAVGIALFALVDPAGDAGSWTRLLPGLLITGLTLGILMPLSSELTVAAAPQDQIGVAASAGTMFRQVGNSVGVAIMGVLMSTQADDAADEIKRQAADGALSPERIAAVQQRAVTEGLQHGAWFAAAVTLAAVAVVLLFVRNLPHTAEPKPAPVGAPLDATPVADAGRP